jgi:hypothetical protein
MLTFGNVDVAVKVSVNVPFLMLISACKERVKDILLVARVGKSWVKGGLCKVDQLLLKRLVEVFALVDVASHPGDVDVFFVFFWMSESYY